MEIRYNVTLREWLHARNSAEEDVDVQVDGTDCFIAVCFGEMKFTKEALEYFKDCLDNMYVCENIILSKNDEDYADYEERGEGRLALTEELLKSLAGYCSCEDYEKWFENEEATLI